MRILVTGAGGFVGRAACTALAEKGHTVIAATRHGDTPDGAAEGRATGDLAELAGDPSSMDRLLGQTDAVLHLAARVHVMKDRSADPAAQYRRMNVDVTRHLAQAALRSGVGRFVFLSSIKVNGETTGGQPFTEDDPPAPEDPYGQSKWEAEQALAEVAAKDGLEVAVLRPPLIYGPGVGANFLSLLRLCDTSLPVPLGGITENRRSLLYVGNLADAIAAALTHKAAAGQTFLVCDGPPVSTAELVDQLQRALGRPARQIPVPPGLLHALLACAGRSAAADRLVGSLEIDSSRIQRVLGWRAPWTLQAGLTATAAWYLRQASTGG